ncbi:hypothetical protein B0H14DRAFT_2594823 [Mycena olivaceomarginata]|nr:hypothetical protein B0H14DRAFT_2594823 [Mycena olivaceomarginata]
MTRPGWPFLSFSSCIPVSSPWSSFSQPSHTASGRDPIRRLGTCSALEWISVGGCATRCGLPGNSVLGDKLYVLHRSGLVHVLQILSASVASSIDHRSPSRLPCDSLTIFETRDHGDIRPPQHPGMQSGYSLRRGDGVRLGRRFGFGHCYPAAAGESITTGHSDWDVVAVWPETNMASGMLYACQEGEMVRKHANR